MIKLGQKSDAKDLKARVIGVGVFFVAGLLVLSINLYRLMVVRYEEFNGVPSLRQPQLSLKPFDRDRLIKVALKLRSIHPDLAAEEAERRVPRELVEQLVDKVTEGFHGDVGVVPRQFLRTFVNILDLLADDPDQDAHALLGFKPAELTVEEQAVMAGRKLDEPPPDDGFGGASVDM